MVSKMEYIAYLINIGICGRLQNADVGRIDRWEGKLQIYNAHTTTLRPYLSINYQRDIMP